MSDDLAFVGDIHGCVTPLEHLLTEVVPVVNHVVFLGDYVNRGPNSRQVLETLLALKSSGRVKVTLLRGNHDAVFQQVLSDPAAEGHFLRMGGAATIRSYIAPPYVDVFKRLRETVPRTHIDLLDSLADSWTDGQVMATHQWNGAAGEGHAPYIVAGHSVLASGFPSILRESALIDTGCGTKRDGRLTAFLWPSRDWRQVQAPLE